MLIKPKFASLDPRLAAILAVIGQSSADPVELAHGVYQINHFNGGNTLDRSDGWGSLESDYPALGEITETRFGQLGSFNSYGVCDNYQQVLDQCPELVSDPKREFVLFLTEVRRENESPEGGWRWHKWGPYIGTFNPQCEYLYDEIGIDRVFTYHIHERIK